MNRAKLRVLVLGAGFGGLELTSILSERMGDRLDLTLIDRNGSFFFGYSKLDVMFGRKTAQSVRHPYSLVAKKGVRFCQEQILSLDPETRKVRTDRGNYQADVLVVALGADYDIGATPGLPEAGHEFYSFEGAEKVRDALPGFRKGHALIAVTGFPFKCPPAPSETALLLDEYLTRQGVRQNCEISLVLPFELPIPPSLGTSKELLHAFQEKGIRYIPEIMVGSLDPGRKIAELDDGREIPFDLFLGIPEHRVPKVVEESGLVFDEWVPVDRNNLQTRYPGVYAIGDVTSAGTPKSGVFARTAAEAAAGSILELFDRAGPSEPQSGKGFCYVEFGQGMVGRTDVDFFTGQNPTGSHRKASPLLAEEKGKLEEYLVSRWFGLPERTSS